jgi:hypothetical protein
MATILKIIFINNKTLQKKSKFTSFKVLQFNSYETLYTY